VKHPLALPTLLFSILTLLTGLLFGAPKEEPSQQAAPLPPSLRLYRADWLNCLPPQGAINSPWGFMKATAPGERLAVVILSGGVNTEALGDKVSYDLRLSVGDQVLERKTVRPDMERRVKAEGADFVLEALKGAGTKQDELEKIRQNTQMNSFAFFTLGDWSVPVVPEQGELVVEGTWTQEGKTQRLEPLRIPILSIAEWYKKPTLSKEELSKSLRRYHPEWCAGDWVQLFHTVTGLGLNTVTDEALFSAALSHDEVFRKALLELGPVLEPSAKRRAYDLLQAAGIAQAELSAAFPDLPATSTLKGQQKRDYRKGLQLAAQPKPQDFKNLGNTMDACWASWMATGDNSYLGAVVHLLEGAEDHELFKKWQSEKSLDKHMNIQALRGIAYQVAGWSVGSFKRTDPLVSDWLVYWQNDASTPKKLVNELEKLSTNPAFKR